VEVFDGIAIVSQIRDLPQFACLSKGDCMELLQAVSCGADHGCHCRLFFLLACGVGNLARCRLDRNNYSAESEQSKDAIVICYRRSLLRMLLLAVAAATCMCLIRVCHFRVLYMTMLSQRVGVSAEEERCAHSAQE